MSEEAAFASRAPLADRMRPSVLDDFVGQEHVLGPGKPLRLAIEHGTPPSLVLWGPPGSGKTTLAHIIAHTARRVFVAFSAVLQGVKEVRAIVDEAKARRAAGGRGAILFVDEIHRFNKAQQDAFLPHVESGDIVLIGATTENPSFEVNPALLSRCRVCVLHALPDDAVAELLRRACAAAGKGLADFKPEIDEDALGFLAAYANGDARAALNALEFAVACAPITPAGGRRVDLALARDAIAQRAVHYDKRGEEYYNLISVFIKSMRGSDPQAAVYWLQRLLEGGADPLYVARRLVRQASEDVGLADPRALQQALAAKDAVHFLGLPEAGAALAQAAVYIATAPKSNALEVALARAARDVRETRNEPVPQAFRNAPTRLMKDLGNGRGYAYDHDAPDRFSGQEHLPPNLAGRVYYDPPDIGFERDVRKRMEYWNRLRAERRGERPHASGSDA